MHRCKNPACMVLIGANHWVAGYCSQRCANNHGADTAQAELKDPTDPDGRRVIAANSSEIDAMLFAGEVDPRLPKIIYLRKRGLSLRQIGRKLNPSLHPEECNRIIHKAPQEILKACGV